jgi:hypothetical protein
MNTSLSVYEAFTLQMSENAKLDTMHFSKFIGLVVVLGLQFRTHACDQDYFLPFRVKFCGFRHFGDQSVFEYRSFPGIRMFYLMYILVYLETAGTNLSI